MDSWGNLQFAAAFSISTSSAEYVDSRVDIFSLQSIQGVSSNHVVCRLSRINNFKIEPGLQFGEPLALSRLLLLSVSSPCLLQTHITTLISNQLNTRKKAHLQRETEQSCFRGEKCRCYYAGRVIQNGEVILVPGNYKEFTMFQAVLVEIDTGSYCLGFSGNACRTRRNDRLHNVKHSGTFLLLQRRLARRCITLLCRREAKTAQASTQAKYLLFFSSLKEHLSSLFVHLLYIPLPPKP